MITIKQSGSFKNTEKFFKKALNANHLRILNRYGKAGVDALASVTPVDSGLTASSWGYTIRTSRNSASIFWTNSNYLNGVPIAILIQYGHATKNGTYVQGVDFVNPAIKPIVDKLANEIWKEVTET